MYSLENRTKMKSGIAVIDTDIILFSYSLENRAKIKSEILLTVTDITLF